MNFQIAAQEERGEAQVLANPTVLSLNNMPAKVEIKRQIPYLSAINSDQGSIGTVSFIDVGTEVNILPRITNNGYVQMAIEPNQIIDTGLRVVNTPVTDERNVTASVIVKDEQTIALGGLREFTATASETGVPFLMRLPVLSWLFKNQENNQRKTELYLFVTPHIVKDPTPTAYQMGLYDKIDYNWDLPDYYFDQVYTRKAPAEENDPSIKRR
ncbi:MAG: type II and III secretion system protein [Candidatus Sumerlaeota bacterium]